MHDKLISAKNTVLERAVQKSVTLACIRNQYYDWECFPWLMKGAFFITALLENSCTQPIQTEKEITTTLSHFFFLLNKPKQEFHKSKKV